MLNRPLDILVLWTNPNPKIRVAYYDLVFAFHRHSGHRCTYWNTSFGKLPERILKRDFDIIVFNALFMSEKWTPWAFEVACDRVKAIKNRDAFKIAFPQDEYVYGEHCCAFLKEFKVNHLCTLGPAIDWPIIYGSLDPAKITIEQILPGYLEPATMERIAPFVAAQKERPLHIGYRAWRSEPWLGRHGRLKGRVADEFAPAAARAGLPVDISVDLANAIIGDDWYKFLASCKYTIGCEGGSSVYDPTGSIRERVNAYVREHPGAKFEQIEAACFPGQDWSIHHTMITPRHLECASTGTAQMLVEANYNGILKPWVHYIPVKRDFSNVDEVLERSRDEKLRRELVENSKRDIVDSGRYTYRYLVRDLMRRIAPRLELRRKGVLEHVSNVWKRRRKLASCKSRSRQQRSRAIECSTS